MTTPQIDKPEAGYYRTKRNGKGAWVPVRIWHGPPPDPDNPGEVLDRSWRWQATIDGQECDPYEIWTWVAGMPITEAEYITMLEQKAWDRLYDPGSPTLRPFDPIDWLTIRPPF